MPAILAGLSGSSPLARGTLPHIGRGGLSCGLIPARAGNTLGGSARRGSKRAHPRSRGEHSIRRFPLRQYRGSSPLARGTPQGDQVGYLPGGLIPARAGNTRISGASRPGRWAHPRSRGEHRLRMVPGHPRRGSSPLARGTQNIPAPAPVNPGLIPARAGNTFRRKRTND